MLMRFLREYLLFRFLRGRGRRRRGYGRSNVHVSGCCLPIPLVVALSTLSGLLALKHRHASN